MLASAAASYVDYEQLLWVPGEKTIFLPSHSMSEAQIVGAAIDAIANKLRDALFWALLDKHNFNQQISERTMRVPLQIRPGGLFGSK
jgi:hypothetical protein